MAYKSKELDVQSYSYMYTCLMIKTMLLASLEATIASPFIYVGALKKRVGGREGWKDLCKKVWWVWGKKSVTDCLKSILFYIGYSSHLASLAHKQDLL